MIMSQKSGKFSQKACQLALTIPFGRVTTYGLLCAASGGHPMMSRMITTILSKSPDVNLIPFHRIVYSNGKIWRDPKYDKWRDILYKQEGIKVGKNNKIINFEQILYTF